VAKKEVKVDELRAIEGIAAMCISETSSAYSRLGGSLIPAFVAV
jgi:hypothetical protein